MPHKLLGNYRHATDALFIGHLHHPGHLGQTLGNAAVDFTLHRFYNFGTPLLPPHFCRCHSAPVVQHQRVRQIWERIRHRSIVVCMIRRRFIAARSRP